MLLGSLTLGVVYAEPIYAFFGWPVGLFLFQKKNIFQSYTLKANISFARDFRLIFLIIMPAFFVYLGMKCLAGDEIFRSQQGVYFPLGKVVSMQIKFFHSRGF
jgi:hypothetical protein